MEWVIKTVAEPTLFVKEVIPNEGEYLPILTNDVEIAMTFTSLENANNLITMLNEPSNFIGHRPPRRPK